ncbi:MAG: uroporphyrinogen decarboxylase family protein [Tissierellia bacterium]|nr:uroporphyrinogen decarboxylase family protein [Tissierellia bacterium]
MYKDDKMTPMERLGAFMTGEPMDRILIMPFCVSIAHRVLGMTHREKRSSARNQADAQFACYDRYGNDLLIIEYGLHGLGSALGTKMNDPEDSVPAITEHVLKDLNQIDDLDFSLTKLDKDPWFQSTLEATKLCIQEKGTEVPTGVLISGPFTAASSIYPMDKMLKASRKEPELLHKLIRKCTDALKEIYLEYIKAGAFILQCDPIASGTILRESQYVEFVKPYATELSEMITAVGGVNAYHICGNTRSIVNEMQETGASMISVDNIVDMEFVKERIGDQIPILGNVDPVGVLLLGSREEIFEAVRIAIAKSYDSPSGYILASGCDITQNVPVENVDYFMEAGRYFGKMPLDLEKIGRP